MAESPGDEGFGENVLVSQQMPLISSQVIGPRKILIGRASTYRIRLSNAGQMAAKDVVATIDVPAWADVVGSVTSIGVMQRSIDSQLPNKLQWQLPELAAQQSETLDLKLIPRSGKPLALGVSWTSAPVGSQAIVEVQEPMLKMTVNGPDEVLFGKPQTYRLGLSNPGTGVAEKIVIHLYPPGGGRDRVSSHTIGDLAAGDSKSVEVMLTAREVGKLAIRAEASAMGDISTEVLREVLVRKPELEIDWRGPESKYSGTGATFYLRVRNPGTATAEGVFVEAEVPDGAELVNASGVKEVDEAERTIRWDVGSLAAGEENFMEVRFLVHRAGTNSMRLIAQSGDGQLEDAQIAQTHVIAVADLQLEVSDPKGPLALTDPAVYEIRVTNRGTNAARAVNVVAMFSDGIEPIRVEGAQHSIHDGRVAFQTIDSLPAGRDIVLRIQARAQEPGTHVFRTEVVCTDLEAKLTTEETTRYYEDDTVGESVYAADRAGAFDGARR